MSSKGQRGNCIYNRQWELNSKYKGWLTAFKADRKKALCKCCDRMIDISNIRESALKSHMKSERHKNKLEVNRLWHYPHSVLYMYHVEMGIQLKQEKWELCFEAICEKTQWCCFLRHKIKFHAGKAEGMILYNPILWLYDIIFTRRNCYFGVTGTKCDIVLVEMDSLNTV